MKVDKRVLATLDKVYAVCAMRLEGEIHFLAATEAHGQCLLFSPPDWTPSIVWDQPGGTMSLVPLQKRESFLAIQEFYPVFKSDHAGIVFVQKKAGKTQPWHVQRVLDLPFVHRIEVVKINSVNTLFASTLCQSKQWIEDWSDPGAVYVGVIPENPNSPWNVEPILEGITKNHGMCATRLKGQTTVLISGEEGVFSIERDPLRNTWDYQKIIENEVSDVFVFDLDEDGNEEIVTIEPFHGDSFAIYQFLDHAWKRVFRDSMNFGHVVWAGKIQNTPSLIVGSREGKKELAVLSINHTCPWSVEPLYRDEDIGPTQIAVVHETGHDLVLAANHGSGEVVLYDMKND